MTFKQRKVAKHGVVTTLGFPEGQLVTVARVDERTQIISTESPERVDAMVRALSRPPEGRHQALTERLQGKPHAAHPLPRARQEGEADAALSDQDAARFSDTPRARRPF